MPERLTVPALAVRAPEYDFPQTELAGSYLTHDETVGQYLSEVANDMGFAAQDIRIQSHTFEGMNITDKEIGYMIDTVRQAARAPGVRAANAELVRMRDWETLEHEYRVAILAVIAALRAGCTPEEIEAIAIAGLIHDNGKALGVAGAANSKPKWDSDQDRRDAEQHPELGVENAQQSGVLNDAALDLTGMHHEDLMAKKDEHGRDIRPYGISISAPQLVRHAASAFLRHLFSAADYIDARCNPRHYREDEENITAPRAIAAIPSDLNTPSEVLGIFNGMIA